MPPVQGSWVLGFKVPSAGDPRNRNPTVLRAWSYSKGPGFRVEFFLWKALFLAGAQRPLWVGCLGL